MQAVAVIHCRNCCRSLMQLLHHLLLMQVGTARGALEQGVNELVVAKQYQKSSRRWMCWVALVILVIIAVVVIAVVIAVKH